MTIDNKYQKYLEHTENGVKIKDNTPEKIKKEIQEINKTYKENYGENLIQE